jgi:hypothetical protein
MYGCKQKKKIYNIPVNASLTKVINLVVEGSGIPCLSEINPQALTKLARGLSSLYKVFKVSVTSFILG